MNLIYFLLLFYFLYHYFVNIFFFIFLFPTILCCYEHPILLHRLC